MQAVETYAEEFSERSDDYVSEAVEDDEGEIPCGRAVAPALDELGLETVPRLEVIEVGAEA